MKNLIIMFFFVIFAAIFWISWDCLAFKDDASVLPKDSFWFKIYSDVFVTSAKFDESSKAVNLAHLSQLAYVKNWFELSHGITDNFMLGATLPVGYVKKSLVEEDSFSDTFLENPWIIVKYQFWPGTLCLTSSLRIKIPITDVDPLEEHFNVEEKQVDIYPIFYIDWQMPIGTYIYSQMGYKYRMKSERIKPGDELRLLIETGYAIVPGIIRIFTYSDYVRFFGGKIKGEVDITGSGYLYIMAAGVRFFLNRNLRVEVLTNATPIGKNQLRGIGGSVGICYFAGK